MNLVHEFWIIGTEYTSDNAIKIKGFQNPLSYLSKAGSATLKNQRCMSNKGSPIFLITNGYVIY